MSNSKYKRLKLACYASSTTMSVVGNLSPLLFLIFREQYGISYSLLGLLVLLNFTTQLLVDLIFSFFSHRFNISNVVKTMPILSISGMFIYAIVPILAPHAAFWGLSVGTVIFSASSGLAEVLISPIVAAIPAKNPEREMSKLHSVYAWGVVGVVVFSTVFLLIFKSVNWFWLPLIYMLLPICAFFLFRSTEIPAMDVPEKVAGVFTFLKNRAVIACIIAIFLGGAAECTMAQWASGYLERALGIPKLFGDIFGVALFSAALGFGRTLFSKIGKSPSRAILLGAIGATVCYTAAAVTDLPIIGLFACVATGFCVSMLWPGCLLVASDRFPSAGVVIYALMASGGDLGASVGPQLVGIITDLSLTNPFFISLASSLSMTPDTLGMKLGLLVGALFPLASIPLYVSFRKKEKKAIKDRSE